MEGIEKLRTIIENSSNIVFFGGAGVSTESGIPDFRSTDGLYSLKYKYPPETIVSHSFFLSRTEEFYEFYKDKMMNLTAKPNKAHLKLAQWEQEGKLKAVITQNIDGLHQMAGSKEVLELHGSIHRNYCERCHQFYDASFVKESEGVPRCTKCGGVIKPDVVLYEEALNDEILNKSISAIRDADLMIVAGTSLTVYPASGLINFYNGSKLVLINRENTQYDRKANLVINESLGKIFKEI